MQKTKEIKGLYNFNDFINLLMLEQIGSQLKLF